LVQLWGALVGFMTGLINWFYHLTVAAGIPSYGIAIILLTVLIKLILAPLTHKQMISMRKMTQLQPKIKEVQDRYKGKDPKKAQEKVMELYKENNVNPMLGCLPLIVQMPILMALYRALYRLQVDPDHARFLWVPDISQVYHISITQPQTLLFPILAGVTTFLQSKLTTSPTDQTQRTMLIMMPLFIAYICTTVPAGLALYWTTFNLFGYIQQAIVNKQLGHIKEGAPSK